MYIAVTYIGGKYVPGEVISEDMPEESLNWLIQSGAVRKAAPAPLAAVDSDQEPDDEASDEDAQEADEALDDEPAEIDEDEEAPEIDVMAGIVKDEPEAAKEPAPKARNAGKKKVSRTLPAHEIAAKGGKAT